MRPPTCHLHRPQVFPARPILRGLAQFACCLPLALSAPAAALAEGALAEGALAEGALPIADIDRAVPVDFATEVHPLLKANCLACHNATQAQGNLVLESPAAMLKGGDSGPAVVPGKSSESLLLKVAAHQEAPAMPPAANEVGARNLTSQQLGLVRLWIDQGAQGTPPAQRQIAWQSPPSQYQPIFALDVTGDGRWAACGHGNRLFVYHLPTRQPAAELVDPELTDRADLDAVRSLAFSRDGRWLAAGGFRQANLWRAPHIDKIADWQAPGQTTAVAVNPAGNKCLTGNADGKLQLRNLAAPQNPQQFNAHTGQITALRFAAAGDLFYSASLDKTVRAFKPDGACVATWQTPSAVHDFLLLEESQQLITAGADNVIRIWNLADAAAAPLAELTGHTGPVLCLATVPGEKEFLSGSEDGTIRKWNRAEGQQLATYSHQGSVQAVAIRADGARMASVGLDNKLKLWDAVGGTMVAEFQGDPRALAEVARLDGELAFTKSAIDLGKRDIKAYAGPERRITVTAEAVKKAETELAKAETDLTAKITDAEKVKGDEKKQATAEKARQNAETARDVAITVVDRAQAVAQRAVQDLAAANAAVAANEARYAQLEQARLLAQQAAADSAAPLHRVAFSPDGQRLFAAGKSGLLHALDATHGAPLETIAGHESAIVAASLGQEKLVTVSAAGQAIVWQTENRWQRVHTFGGSHQPGAFADRVLALDFSPDGSLLATGSGLPGRSGELKIWRVADGSLVQDLASHHTDTVFGLRFSPNGQLLASVAADRKVLVCDTTDWKTVRNFPGHTAHVLAVDWNAGGTLLATGSADRTIKLWDFAAGLQVQTYKGQTYRVGPYKGDLTAIRFVGNSEQFVGASGDGTVRLHRTSSTDDILTFTGSSGYQYAAAVSRDGRDLLAGGADGKLRLWTGQDRAVKYTFELPSTSKSAPDTASTR